MTDDRSQQDLVSHQAFTFARWRRSTRRLAKQLERISSSTLHMQGALEDIHQFLEHQHQHFQELIARSDDVEQFCRRCQDIIDGDDPERMVRERDWLLASYRKRNVHRRPWLARLGLRT